MKKLWSWVVAILMVFQILIPAIPVYAEEITTIRITDFTAPVAGAELDFTISTPAGGGYTVESFDWVRWTSYYGGPSLSPGEKFRPGRYSLSVRLKAKDGFTFPADGAPLSITLDDVAPWTYIQRIDSSDTSLVSVEFTFFVSFPSETIVNKVAVEDLRSPVIDEHPDMTVLAPIGANYTIRFPDDARACEGVPVPASAYFWVWTNCSLKLRFDLNDPSYSFPAEALDDPTVMNILVERGNFRTPIPTALYKKDASSQNYDRLEVLFPMWISIPAPVFYLKPKDTFTLASTSRPYDGTIPVPSLVDAKIVNVSDETELDDACYAIERSSLPSADAGTYPIEVRFKIKDCAPFEWGGEYLFEGIRTIHAETFNFTITKVKAVKPASDPIGLKGELGASLSTISLPAGYKWKDWTQILDWVVGEKKNYKVLYNPNPINYIDSDEFDLEVELITTASPKHKITFNFNPADLALEVKQGATIISPADPSKPYEYELTEGVKYTWKATKAGYNDKSADYTVGIADATIDVKLEKKATGSSSGGGYSGWGGGSLTRDACPQGDSSPSYYDGKCKASESSFAPQQTGEKKADPVLSEQTQAYERAYKHGITTISGEDNARLTEAITRAELAKMMAVYAMNMLGRAPVLTWTASYSDVGSELGDLEGFIQLAYQLQIMGIEADGSPLLAFNPNGLITRAEFATVLSRVLWWAKYNQEGADFASKHLTALKEAGILKDTTPNLQEMRGWVMLMLQRSEGIK